MVWEILSSTATGVAFFAALAGCILVLLPKIVYKLWFHPLAKYPGPVLAKVTNLYGAYHAWRGDLHTDMLRCHMKYGDRIRYAPNRILINTPQALQDLYGHGAHVQKYSGYQALSSQAANTLTMADKKQHAIRRRVLSQAFSDNSLRMLEPTIQSRIDRFCRSIRIQQGVGDTWTVTDLAFDLMTAVLFDMDYNTIEEAQFRYVVEAIETSNVRLGVLLQAPELNIGGLDKTLFPESARAATRFVKFLKRLLRERLQRKTHDDSPGDMFSFLQRCEDPETGEALSLKEISTETATFIVAGSDTTSTTMASLSHYLAHSPRHYSRAQHEVRSKFTSAADIKFGPALNSCVFLRACLNEAMRLTPAGGAALWREVQTTGTMVDGEYLPGGCEIGASIYAMHRSSRNWSDAHRYMPDRWLLTDKADTPVGKGAARQPYFPFNIGPRSCVGKPLALAEVMLTFARLLWEFDFRPVQSDSVGLDSQGNGETDQPEYILKDHVTGQKQGPMLCFQSRLA